MTVTEYVPAVLDVTVKVELFVWPGVNDRLLGFIVAVRFEDETDVESMMVP